MNNMASDTSIFSLSGKTALVVGGGSGLGRAMALALSKAGANVAVADLNLAGAEASAADIVKLGRNAVALHVDVTKQDQVEKMVVDTVRVFGELNIAVNSAGVPGSRFGSSENIPESEIRRIIGIMLIGCLLCAQAEGRQMIKQGKGGRIINIASISGIIINRGLVGLAPYAAAKAGVRHFTKALASDWARYNITVNSISPGYMRTPATEPVLAIPERYQLYLDNTPLRRIGMPEDLSGAVVFLASDASSYVTGHDLVVDGGHTIW